MMGRKVGRLTADIGKYTQYGEEKTEWLNCGVVFENNGKLSVLMKATPASKDWSGWYRIFLEDGLALQVTGTVQPREPKTWQGEHPKQQQRSQWDGQNEPF